MTPFHTLLNHILFILKSGDTLFDKGKLALYLGLNGWVKLARKYPPPFSDVAITIANTNYRELLRACLPPIMQETHRYSHQIYVLDNASTILVLGAILRRFSRSLPSLR